MPTDSQSEPSLDAQLITAARKGETELVRSLLASGASAAFVSDPPGVWGSCDRKTALHMALKAQSRDAILLLIKASADVNAIRAESDWRGCGCRESAFDMLLSSPLGTDPAVLEVFIAAGADPNKQCTVARHSMRTDGQTVSSPLHTAVQRSNANVCGVLLRAGASVDARHTKRYHNERGFNQDKSETALHMAVDRKSLDLVVLLLAEGADPNALATRLVHEESGLEGTTDDPREEGFEPSVKCVPVRETAVHRAVLTGQIEVVKALLAAGADRTTERVYGETRESMEVLVAKAEDECTHLAKGDLGIALQTSQGWTLVNHKYFSANLREQVRTVLLVAKAADWMLPDDALHKIFAELAIREP